MTSRRLFTLLRAPSQNRHRRAGDGLACLQGVIVGRATPGPRAKAVDSCSNSCAVIIAGHHGVCDQINAKCHALVRAPRQTKPASRVPASTDLGGIAGFRAAGARA